MAAPSSGLTSRSLVLGLVDAEGVLHASDAYDVGRRLGFTLHQVRLVMARLVEEGSFMQQGRGRKALLRATNLHELIHGPEPDWLALAFEQDAGRSQWDGSWHIVTFAIGEERRRERALMRDALHSLGAAMLTPSVYVHALDWDSHVLGAADALGILDSVVVGTVSAWSVYGITEPRRIAARLWPLEAAARGYTEFIERHASAVDAIEEGAGDGSDAIAALTTCLEVIAAFEACIRKDPLLPPELLPSDWPGRAAREVLLDGSSQFGLARSAVNAPRLFSRYDAVIAAHKRTRRRARVK